MHLRRGHDRSWHVSQLRWGHRPRPHIFITFSTYAARQIYPTLNESTSVCLQCHLYPSEFSKKPQLCCFRIPLGAQHTQAIRMKNILFSVESRMICNTCLTCHDNKPYSHSPFKRAFNLTSTWVPRLWNRFILSLSTGEKKSGEPPHTGSRAWMAPLNKHAKRPLSTDPRRLICLFAVVFAFVSYMCCSPQQLLRIKRAKFHDLWLSYSLASPPCAWSCCRGLGGKLDEAVWGGAYRSVILSLACAGLRQCRRVSCALMLSTSNALSRERGSERPVVAAFSDPEPPSPLVQVQRK